MESERRAAELAFGLETIPDAKRLKAMPPIHPDRNLRDPEKVKKNLEAKKARQLEEAALNPHSGKILCAALYGTARDGATSELVIFDKCERRLLRRFWEAAGKTDRFITFNGIEFHVPFLLFRSWLSGVKPTVAIDTGRYRLANHCDVRMMLTNWDRYANGTLEDRRVVARRSDLHPVAIGRASRRGVDRFAAV